MTSVAALVGRAPTIARLRGAETARVRSNRAAATVQRRSTRRSSVVVNAGRSDFTVPDRMLSLDDVKVREAPTFRRPDRRRLPSPPRTLVWNPRTLIRFRHVSPFALN